MLDFSSKFFNSKKEEEWQFTILDFVESTQLYLSDRRQGPLEPSSSIPDLDRSVLAVAVVLVSVEGGEVLVLLVLGRRGTRAVRYGRSLAICFGLALGSSRSEDLWCIINWTCQDIYPGKGPSEYLQNVYTRLCEFAPATRGQKQPEEAGFTQPLTEKDPHQSSAMPIS